eukprot:1192852-Prorocentrum_minimum.AAC.6
MRLTTQREPLDESCSPQACDYSETHLQQLLAHAEVEQEGDERAAHARGGVGRPLQPDEEVHRVGHARVAGHGRHQLAERLVVQVQRERHGVHDLRVGRARQTPARASDADTWRTRGRRFAKCGCKLSEGHHRPGHNAPPSRDSRIPRGEAPRGSQGG